MIPRFVVVGGLRYVVERAPKRKIGGPADISQNKGRIRLADELPERVARHYLEHEKDHAAWYQSGAYTILRAYTTRADECEEQLLDAFGPCRRGAVEIP